MHCAFYKFQTQNNFNFEVCSLHRLQQGILQGIAVRNDEGYACLPSNTTCAPRYIMNYALKKFFGLQQNRL